MAKREERSQKIFQFLSETENELELNDENDLFNNNHEIKRFQILSINNNYGTNNMAILIKELNGKVSMVEINIENISANFNAEAKELCNILINPSNIGNAYMLSCGLNWTTEGSLSDQILTYSVTCNINDKIDLKKINNIEFEKVRARIKILDRQFFDELVVKKVESIKLEGVLMYFKAFVPFSFKSSHANGKTSHIYGHLCDINGKVYGGIDISSWNYDWIKSNGSPVSYMRRGDCIFFPCLEAKLTHQPYLNNNKPFLTCNSVENKKWLQFWSNKDLKVLFIFNYFFNYYMFF